MFADCDLLIVEGDSQTGADKIEVWRASRGDSPLIAADAEILALLTDDGSPVSCRQFTRDPIDQLIDWIVDRNL